MQSATEQHVKTDLSGNLTGFLLMSDVKRATKGKADKQCHDR